MNEPAGMEKDSCVVLYWAEQRMPPKSERTLSFTYGLGQMHGEGGSGQYKGRLALLTAGSATVGKVFTATAYLKNTLPGQSVKGEFRCSECGYGVTIARVLPLCPMCGGSVWEQSLWSPFTRRAAAPL